MSYESVENKEITEMKNYRTTAATCERMKKSSEFPVEEMLLPAILCDSGLNEEKVIDYQEKIRGVQEKMEVISHFEYSQSFSDPPFIQDSLQDLIYFGLLLFFILLRA